MLVSNWQYDSIGSDNGMAPNRRHAIIWSNVGMLYWRIYASLSPNELMNNLKLDCLWFSRHADMHLCCTYMTVLLVSKTYYTSSVYSIL